MRGRVTAQRPEEPGARVPNPRGMLDPVHLPADATAVNDVRVKCAECGAHTMAWKGRTLTGTCGNCGSYDVRPLPVPPWTDRAER
jgi:hypothetical protein